MQPLVMCIQVIKQLKLVKLQLVMQRLIESLMVSEQFIFQQDSIQLSPSIYQQEHIQHIYLSKLKGRIQFNIQQRNNP
jgi:hypothetical protein